VTPLLWIILVLSVLGSLFFSTLTYALRDFSRARLAEVLDKYDRAHLLDPTIRCANDFILITAFFRLLTNVVVLLCILWAIDSAERSRLSNYLIASAVTLALLLFLSVAVPHALSRHLAEPIIAQFIGILHALRIALFPLIKLMHWVELGVLKLTGAPARPPPTQIEQEILSVVEEGQKEGIVDAQAREMIESVIEFRDTQVGQIMTPRPEIVALEVDSNLSEVQRTLIESGHSRIPVYDGTLDQIVGVLYARDLLKHLGAPPDRFNLRGVIRPATFVPETKPLRDLLRDFRRNKVHIAVVADEYGGSAGIVTIEDILKELVGDLGDEHQPAADHLFNRIDDSTAEVDAKIAIPTLNQRLALNLPEDAGYETLGGFVAMAMGHVPPPGSTFEQDRVRYTVLTGEPQRVERVKIEILPHPTRELARTVTPPAPPQTPPATPKINHRSEQTPEVD
jgi:CBS domain containing-hemolysin-like protein